PQRTLPRAFVLGIAVVTATYVLTSMAFLGLTAPAQAPDTSASAARLGEALFGARGGAALALGVVVSVLGSLCALMLASPRLYVALARDGLFPERLGRGAPPPGAPGGGGGGAGG